MIPGDTLLPISANLIGAGSGALQIPHHVDPSAANPNPNHLMRQDHHHHLQQQKPQASQQHLQQQLPPPPAAPPKKKRNLPGTPDPDAEVVSLSPGTLMATNRFVCEICGKGFQRDQNLQLHRRGHNLPWKLRQRPSVKDGAPPPRKKVYVCPEKTCVHNDPSRALGDLTGIKKHFSRKHGEKKWKCDKCSKKYAVQSDWKAHTKTCGTREYKCDCGTIFSRKDSFITHRAFCDALMEETTKYSGASATASGNAVVASFVAGNNTQLLSAYGAGQATLLSPHDMAQMTAPDGRLSQKQDDLSLAWLDHQAAVATNALLGNSMDMPTGSSFLQPPCSTSLCLPSVGDVMQTRVDGSGTPGFAPLSMYGTNDSTSPLSSAHMSATALLQKAAQMGATMSSPPASTFAGFGGLMLPRTKGMLPQQQLNSGRNEMEETMAMNKAHAGVVPDHSIQHATTSKTTAPAPSQASAMEAKYGNLLWGNSSGDGLLGGGADLTRDFLGLGGAGGGPGDQHHHHQLAQAGRPFSAEDLTRLASIGSGMDAISSAAAYGSCRR